MKLELWALIYVIAGVALSVTLVKRGVITAKLDVALVTVAWPLYAPSVLSATREPVVSHPDVEKLARAIDAVSDPVWRPLLPSPNELSALGARVRQLDVRVKELDELVASDPDGSERFVVLATAARDDRERLLHVLARLRVEITALRFAEGGPDDARARVEELLARLRDAQSGIDHGRA